MAESRQRGQEVISNLEIYEKKLTEAEAETVGGPLTSWYAPTRLCHGGCRCPGAKQAPGHQHPPRTMSHHVTPNEKKLKLPGATTRFFCLFVCFCFCRVRTLIVIILYVATILQTTFSNAFSGTKIVLFWFRNHWNLCPIKNYPAWCHFLN